MFKNLFSNVSHFLKEFDSHSNIFLLFLVFIFPILFLSVKHGVHLSLYCIFFLYLYELIRLRIRISLSKKAVLISICLSSLFIATALQQIITTNFNINAFDGPSRLLIAGIIFLHLRQKNINYFSIIEIAIPIGLIFLTIYLQLNQQYFWGQRWANSFVDPNSLGTQVTILSMICISTVDINSKKTTNLIKIIGLLCGLYISVKAESRGGWSVIPAMMTCWLVIQVKENLTFNLNRNQLVLTLITLFALIIGAVTLASMNNTIHNRLLNTIYEITSWLRDPTIHTSAGSRLSMWVASTELITENWIGYGEILIKDIATNHPLSFGIHNNGVADLIQAGPHSDILSKGLSLGILGIFSYLAMIFLPFFTFFSKITASNHNIRKAAQMGCIYISGIFIAGLFNETLSLKYLCSFYGLMIACLAADVLRDNSSMCAPNQKAT